MEFNLFPFHLEFQQPPRSVLHRKKWHSSTTDGKEALNP